MNLFKTLEDIKTRPKLFEYYTATDLWADPHTSAQMLSYHLNGDIDISSRNAAFLNRSSEWIAKTIGLRQGTRIIDFGCGPGLYTSRFSAMGADVTGIDFSPRSIEYARAQALKAGHNIKYIQQNYLDYDDSNSFDALTMIMCDFCALSPTQRKQMLSKFRDLLANGGKLFLDVYSSNAFEAREERTLFEKNQLNGFWSADDYYAFVCAFKYDQEMVTLDKYTLVESERTRTVYNWLQHFTPETLRAELEDSGLYIKNTYSNLAGDTYDPNGSEFAVVAEKS